MDDEHPTIHDILPIESSVRRKAQRTIVRSKAISAAVERRIRLLRAWHGDPDNEGVSFFDLHPGEWDFAGAVASEERKRKKSPAVVKIFATARHEAGLG